MKHFKRFAACCAAVACAAAMLLTATGCQQQQEPYSPPEATPQVSKPTIAQEGVLRVGVNASNAPLAGQPSSSTKIVGIDVDMAAALADQLGLKLEVTDVEPGQPLRCRRAKVDLVMGVSKADSSATFWTSDTYLPTAVALFAQSSNSTVPTNTAATKIAAQVSSNSAWAVTNEYDDSTITTTDDLKSAFSSLQSGQVRYNDRRCRGKARTWRTTLAWMCTWWRSCSPSAGIPWACLTETPSSSRPFRMHFPR